LYRFGLTLKFKDVICVSKLLSLKSIYSNEIHTVWLSWPASQTLNLSRTTLGMEAKRMFSGLGSEPMKASHSSVTTEVMRMSVFDASILQRFIMGLM